MPGFIVHAHLRLPLGHINAAASCATGNTTANTAPATEVLVVVVWLLVGVLLDLGGDLRGELPVSGLIVVVHIVLLTCASPGDLPARGELLLLLLELIGWGLVRAGHLLGWLDIVLLGSGSSGGIVLLHKLLLRDGRGRHNDLLRERLLHVDLLSRHKLLVLMELHFLKKRYLNIFRSSLNVCFLSNFFQGRGDSQGLVRTQHDGSLLLLQSTSQSICLFFDYAAQLDLS